MPTFLTTPRMNPALRARIERSVSPRAKAHHRAKETGYRNVFAGRRRLGAGFFIPLAALVVVLVLVQRMRAEDECAIAHERAAVLFVLEAQRGGLPAAATGFLETTQRQIAEVASGPYSGDFVDPELLVPGALDDWLARPSVYIRGATPELGDPSRLAFAASTSIKDAFLMCLVEPAVSHSEHDVMAKIRGVYFAGALVDEATANIRRLDEAREGFAILDPSFEAEVRAADKVTTLKKLGKTLEMAPFAAARIAATAELVIVVADEIDEPTPAPKPAPGTSPLGYRAQEGPHDARVALIERASGRVLLRVRRRLDASGRTKRGAALYRVAIQGCDLALDVRQATEH